MNKLKTKDWFKNPDFPFHVTRVGLGDSYPAHGHEFFEFFLMTEGRLFHSIDGKEQILEKGDIVLLSPSHEHSFHRLPDESASSLQSIFMPSFLGVDLKFLRKEKSFTELIFMLPFYEDGCTVFRLSGKARLKVQTLLEELLGEYTERPRGFETAIKVKLTDLLITVARAYEHEYEKHPRKQTSLSGTAEAILGSLAYIEEHVTEDLELETVARLTAGVTKEYFSKIFHNITGTTFTKYIAGLRIDKAKELLKKTDAKTIAVCFDSGFNDLSHFNRTFKKLAGMTPSEYRRQRREDRK